MCVVEQLLGLLEDVGVDHGQEVEGALEVDAGRLLRITARRSIWKLQRNICLRVFQRYSLLFAQIPTLIDVFVRKEQLKVAIIHLR